MACRLVGGRGLLLAALLGLALDDARCATLEQPLGVLGVEEHALGCRPLDLVGGATGHQRDDVFVSSDASESARAIIEAFSKRWSLEVTFHETKGKLGFEDPQNRAEHAVERTAPLAFVSYSLTVLWYLLYGQYSKAAKATTLPFHGTG